MSALTDETRTRLREEPSFEMLLEYNQMIEELRSRLNVLSTSLFLLSDFTNNEDPKISRYILKINSEMETIRQIITEYPKAI